MERENVVRGVKNSAIQKDIVEARKRRTKVEIDENDVNSFLRYAKYFMEDIDEMLINTKDMRTQQGLFGLVFEGFPTYQEIVSGTPKLSPVFAIKKNQHDADSSLVTPWSAILEPDGPPTRPELMFISGARPFTR